jgi:hypothetical protein
MDESFSNRDDGDVDDFTLGRFDLVDCAFNQKS